MESRRFPSVFFVTPYSPGRFFGGVRPPVGIACLDEYLTQCGFETWALDMCAGASEEDLFHRIEETNPSLIGFTVMTYQYAHTYALMARIKRRFPEIPLIAGGPHASALEGEVLRQCQDLDYVLAGESEKSLRDLCQGEVLSAVPGLFYRGDGAVLQGAPRVYTEDLDQFPFPRYANYQLDRYVGEMEIVTSRGCPHHCIFCSVSGIMGYKVRHRSTDHVLEEIDYHYRRGIRAMQIGDDNFLASKPRVMELLEALRSRGYSDLVLRCGQGIRADLVDREILVAMKDAGFRHLGIGVESASDRVLQVVQKHATLAQIDAAVALACEVGFDVSLFFVVGIPTETLEDLEKSIAFAQKYPVMKAFFYNLIPLPGTRLFERVMENQWMLGSYEEMVNRPDELKLRARPFFATPEMPEADRVKAMAMTERVSKRVQVATLRRKLRRLGPLAPLVAQAGRSDALERLFIRCRPLRSLLDRLIFGAHKRGVRP